MASKTRKMTCTYLLLLSTVLRHSYCQINQGFVNGVSGHTSSTLKQTHSSHFYPSTGFNYPNPAARGFYPASAVNSYYSYPLNGQYWTGQPHHYTKYPQYPQYQQYPQYPQYQQYPQYHNSYWNYPASFKHFPQQFGNAHHQMGYNNYNNYGQYPMFDAQFWMGNNYHSQHMPMFMNPTPIAPVYMHPGQMHHFPMHYNGHHMMYNGHNPYHAVPYPANQYYGNYYDRGFLGGSGSELAKGLLGALVVGTVAGTVARRG